LTTSTKEAPMSRPTTPQSKQPSTREDRATLGVIASYLHDLTPHEQPPLRVLEDEEATAEPVAAAEARAA
jgi:hypothetical protein